MHIFTTGELCWSFDGDNVTFYKSDGEIIHAVSIEHMESVFTSNESRKPTIVKFYPVIEKLHIGYVFNDSNYFTFHQKYYTESKTLHNDLKEHLVTYLADTYYFTLTKTCIHVSNYKTSLGYEIDVNQLACCINYYKQFNYGHVKSDDQYIFCNSQSFGFKIGVKRLYYNVALDMLNQIDIFKHDDKAFEPPKIEPNYKQSIIQQMIQSDVKEYTATKKYIEKSEAMKRIVTLLKELE